MLRVNIDKIARHYAGQTDEELLRIGRSGNLTPEARLALKTELLKRGHTELGWIDKAAAATVMESHGVRGWLLGLCVFVGAVYPGLAAWMALGAWNLLRPVLAGGQAYPWLVSLLLWAVLFLGVAVLALGPWSVIRMRQKDARGPAMARWTLYLVLLGVMAQLLTLGTVLGVEQARTLLGEIGWLYSLHAVVAGGWVVYLNHSRRIRALTTGGSCS